MSDERSQRTPGKRPGGATIPEAERRVRGQTVICLRLGRSETAKLDSILGPDETRLGAIRRLILGARKNRQGAPK